jgi:hypothetical protein
MDVNAMSGEKIDNIAVEFGPSKKNEIIGLAQKALSACLANSVDASEADKRLWPGGCLNSADALKEWVEGLIANLKISIKI